MGILWLKEPLAVWTGTGSNAGGGLVIDGEKIVEVVPAGKQPVTVIDSVFNAEGLVILPGLINCHHHFFQTLTRAFPGALNCRLFDWLKKLYPVWALLEESDIRIATMAAFSELMLSGCTTTVDHHYLFTPKIQHAIDIQAETAIKTGMRAVLCRGAMSLGESAGGLPPNSVVQSENVILAECERLIKKFSGQELRSKVQLVLAPCSPFSVTKELMRASASLARSHGLLLHTHLAETIEETNYCLENFSMRPVEYLDETGWLNTDVWLAHGIHLNKEERARLGESKVAICHCPASNMTLGSGHCRVMELEKAGCLVGLGVDGSASNDCSNMIGELRQAFLLQRLYYGPAVVTHEDALRWGTVGGANVLHRNDIGTIEVGKQADLALFRVDDLRFSGSHDPVAALIFSGAQQVAYLMIGGEWKVWKGELIGQDLAELQVLHRNAAVNLVNRLRDA